MSRAQFHDLPNLLAPDNSELQSRIVQLLDAIQFKPTRFIEGADTPISYTDSEGLYVQSTGSGLIFAPISFEAGNTVYGFHYILNGENISAAPTLYTPDINVPVFDTDGYYDFGLNKNFVIPASRAGTYFILLKCYVETIPDEVNPNRGYVDLHLLYDSPSSLYISYTPYILDDFDDFNDFLFCSPVNHYIVQCYGGEKILVQIENHNNLFRDAVADFEIFGIRIGDNP